MTKLRQLVQVQQLPISLEEAWAFFSTPENLNEITPDDLGFRMTSEVAEDMFVGQIITYRVKIAPLLWVPWVTEIKAVRERHSFVDEQRFGPYRFWHHRHVFEETDGGVKMTDTVHYALPVWPFGEIAHPILVRPKLEWIFSFRKKVLAERFGEMGA